MNTRERRRREQGIGAPQEPNQSGTANNGELRDRASELLAASDRVIERALSIDSFHFLSQTRQAGGQ